MENKKTVTAKMRELTRPRNEKSGEIGFMVVSVSIMQMCDHATVIIADRWVRDNTSVGMRLELTEALRDVRREFARAVNRHNGDVYDKFEERVADAVDEIERHSKNCMDEIKRENAARVKFEALDVFADFVMISVASKTADMMSRVIGLRLAKMDTWLSVLDRMISRITPIATNVKDVGGGGDSVRFYGRKFGDAVYDVCVKMLK